jgi:hypothetical protein
VRAGGAVVRADGGSTVATRPAGTRVKRAKRTHHCAGPSGQARFSGPGGDDAKRSQSETGRSMDFPPNGGRAERDIESSFSSFMSTFVPSYPSWLFNSALCSALQRPEARGSRMQKEPNCQRRRSERPLLLNLRDRHVHVLFSGPRGAKTGGYAE